MQEEQHNFTTDRTTVTGHESISLQQHTYRVLIGPLTEPDLDAARTALKLAGRHASVSTLKAAIETAYQVQVGAYRSYRLAADASSDLALQGEPVFTQDTAPFTFARAGLYDVRRRSSARAHPRRWHHHTQWA